MRKRQQSGFGLVAIIAVVVLFGLIAFVTWRILAANSTSSTGTEQPKQQTTTPPDDVPAGYTKYSDSQNRFTFAYPTTWETKSTNLDGALVALVRPSLKEALQKSANSFYEGPAFSLVVSRWANVNDIVKGEEYVGKRSYANLADFLKDGSSPTKLLGETVVNGVAGYEAINPGIGSQYALLFERTDGVYQFEFSDVAKKDNLSADDKKIIETVKFK